MPTGPRAVKDWIAKYGDPRDPKVDPIDWVERIPFPETRNYVQRVLENLQAYRVRLGGGSTPPIQQDLLRGASSTSFLGEKRGVAKLCRTQQPLHADVLPPLTRLTNGFSKKLDDRFHETAQLPGWTSDRKMWLFRRPHMIQTLEALD
jgi:hypothetical protein